MSQSITGDGRKTVQPAPPSAPSTADDYVALITPAQAAGHAKFVATVQLSAQAAAAVQAFLAALPAAFDLDTAIGVQLDQVGEWIGQSRDVEVPLTGVYFSLDTVGVGLDQGVWQGPFDPTEGLTVLPDDEYRMLLYATVAANNWDGTVPGAAAALANIFNDSNTPGVQLAIIDNQNMTMTFLFTGAPPPAVFVALVKAGIIKLIPMTVGFDVAVGSGPVFGLDTETPMIQGLDQGEWATVP
jgi:hypothetical protein